MNSVYDISKTFEENITYGPFFDGTLPTLPKREAKHTFLGQKVNSLFGVAASPMTFSARSISLFAKLGYDIITYRSVRSMEWHGLGAPNWAYVDVSQTQTLESLAAGFTGDLQPFANQTITTANSFGVQSLKPDNWQHEYERANQSLSPGQILILALMPSTEENREVVSDVITLAHYAIETSADVFEVNLACPNSGSKALIYQDIQTSVAVCKAIKSVIGNKKLVAKVGYFNDQALLKTFMYETREYLAGITSTNTYSASVISTTGNEMFSGRPVAGISGDGIRALSQAQAKQAVEYKRDLDLKDYTIIGIGGVMQPAHIQEYLDIGVDAVQAVTGVWANPYLASEYLKNT